jgi:two-component system, NarL family, response regulator DesR
VIRLLIAGDQVLFRRAVAELLDSRPDLEVVAEVGRAGEVVPAALAARPDVALVDVDLAGLDGIAVAAELARVLPACRVLILTVFGRPGYVRRAVEGGVAGFLLKDATPEELVAAVRRAAAGELVFDPELMRGAIQDGTGPLSDRERQALAMTWRGATVDEIAGRLHLSPGTIRNYLSSAIQKLDARSGVEAARIAEEHGWL